MLLGWGVAARARISRAPGAATRGVARYRNVFPYILDFARADYTLFEIRRALEDVLKAGGTLVSLVGNRDGESRGS